MKVVIQTSSGAQWREIETVAEAMEIGKVTQTAIGHFFRTELRLGVINRYFALGDQSVVIGCVPLTPASDPRKARPANGLPLFVAHSNANPFPEYSREIADLAAAIGAEITANAYPYRQAVPHDEDFLPGNY